MGNSESSPPPEELVGVWEHAEGAGMYSRRTERFIIQANGVCHHRISSHSGHQNTDNMGLTGWNKNANEQATVTGTVLFCFDVSYTVKREGDCLIVNGKSMNFIKKETNMLGF